MFRVAAPIRMIARKPAQVVAVATMPSRLTQQAPDWGATLWDSGFASGLRRCEVRPWNHHALHLAPCIPSRKAAVAAMDTCSEHPHYTDEKGIAPFDRWIDRMRNVRAKARVLNRIDRLSLGLEGDWKSVGEGVRELRIPEGKGYRVYYAWDGDAIILLLCGGDKASQRSDIAKAKEYWRSYHG